MANIRLNHLVVFIIHLTLSEGNFLNAKMERLREGKRENVSNVSGITGYTTNYDSDFI